MLRNRFYLGYITDAKGGWLKAIHQPFIDSKLFEATQKTANAKDDEPKHHPIRRDGIFTHRNCQMR